MSTNKKVKNYFEDHAVSFDNLYDLEGTGKMSRLVNRFFRRGLYMRVKVLFKTIGPLDGKYLLDIGCGSGRQMIWALLHGATHVTGVDMSVGMLELAREYSEKAGVADKTEFIQSDCLALSLNKTFDVVYALGVFDYVEKPVEMLQRMKTFSHGTVCASFPTPSLLRAPFRKLRYSLRGCPLYFRSSADVGQYAQSAGLKNIELIPYASAGLLLKGSVL